MSKKVRLTERESEVLEIAISVWQEDLQELGQLPEAGLYRKYHLDQLAHKLRVKQAEKLGKPEFEMKFEDVEIFTLLLCYDEEKDERLIMVLRPIMAKFDKLRNEKPLLH